MSASAGSRSSNANSLGRWVGDGCLASFSSLVLHPVTIGLLLRLALGWFLPWLLDDGRFLPGVAYTDIDYQVFTDAAAYVRAGGSPYQRTTYRYTPFLADALAALPKAAARHLFGLADVVCGWIIFDGRQRARRRKDNHSSENDSETGWDAWLSPATQDALWWLYNPLAINICTRGSAESLIVLLPVLATLWCVQQPTLAKRPVLRALTVGLVHGVAMHAKVYPVIYSLTLATALSSASTQRQQDQPLLRQQRPSFTQWIRNLLTTLPPLLFGVTALTVFAGLTWLAVQRHGLDAWTQGIWYHAARVDHRHNYSGHWYAVYLVRHASGTGSDVPWWLPWWGRLLLVPQAVWLLVTSWWMGSQPHWLPFCMFVQTLAFVAQNKVITAQYFTWYLVLLPQVHGVFQWTRQLRQAVAFLLTSVILWLSAAYMLEMQNWAVHRLVFVASWVFNAAHIYLICAFLASVDLDSSSSTLGSKQEGRGSIKHKLA